MKIEALEVIKSGSYVLDAGDRKTVPDDIGKQWCTLGWAKDVDGVVPTGERTVIRDALNVQSGKIGVSDTLKDQGNG